jgi:AraC family L-rhamnose operon transcriptional activator RhaR
MRSNIQHDHPAERAPWPQPLPAETSLPRASPLDATRFAPQGSESGLHRHETFEIILITAGTAYHRTMTGYRSVSRGDVIILHPGTWHAVEGCRGLTALTCEITPDLFSRELSWALDDTLLGRLFTDAGQASRSFRLSEQDLPTAIGHFEGLQGLDERSPASHRADLYGRFLLLASCIAQAIPSDRQDTSTTIPDHPAVRSAIEMFNSDLAYDWTLAELATALHLTQGHIVRLFKSGVGLPPMAYLFRLRAKKAALLLEHTEGSIGDIGQSVGWNDPNYFTRRFKTSFGMSPTRYRESQKTE